MRSVDDRLAELEGRLAAHRRLLAHFVENLNSAQRQDFLRWIEEREIPHDGQEDPGAVLTGAEILPLSTAEEFQQIAAIIRGSDG